MQRRGFMLCLSASFAGPVLAGAPAPALDLNTATQAELERLKGVGVVLSERLLQARAQAPFTGWADVRRRVPGFNAAVARRLAAQGLVVSGVSLDGAGAAPAASAASATSATSATSAADAASR
jgi:competence protein ComEA